jgi:hypothetical protein
MRINLIGSFKVGTGLTQDASIIRGLLTNQFGDNLTIAKVQHNMPQCSEAEMNIFIEVMNPALITFAGKNVWIPNQEWSYKTWIPYISMMDEIWVKTREAETIFTKYSDKVKYIGWTSIDKILPEKKNYKKAIVLVGKNFYRNPKPVLKAYYDLLKNDPEVFEKLPELHIPRNSSEVQFFFPPELECKVKLHDLLTEKEYDDLLHECGLAICISACEGFGHAVNEAMSSGCNLILSNIGPFTELTNSSTDVLWGTPLQIIDHPDCLATIVDTSSNSIRSSLLTYLERSLRERKRVSENMRTIYEKRHANFIGNFKCPEVPDYSVTKTLATEESLPDVSIVTLTYNRKEFMALAKYSYLIQSYPEDKLEWVIVDDGESIEESLIGIPNVKYVRLDEKTGIAEKRNIGIRNAMYDHIVFMDDDDVYPNNSVLERIAMMLKSPQKECVFCTTIPCYNIEKYCSFMNVPPMNLEMSERVSEASMGFTRKFWEERNFEDDIGEADKFIRGREQMCREISPQEVIVSLVHSKNISSRKTPEFPEPNGCHYGFNEKLFALVSEIGDTLKAHAE